MTENLIFIYEKFKLDNKILELLNNPNSKIFAMDYYSHKQLDDLKISHEILDSKLNTEDLKKLDSDILRISTTWYLNSDIKDEFIFKNINLGWLLEQELYGSLIPKLIIFSALIKVKKEITPKKIFISKSVSKMINSVFPNIQIGIIDDAEEKKQEWSQDIFPIKYGFGPIQISIRLPRNIFFSLRKKYEKYFIPLFNKLFSNFVISRNSIILVDFNPSHYKLFFEKLNQNNKNILLLNRKRAAMWNISSFKIVKKNKFHLISFQKFINKHDKQDIEKHIQIINSTIDNLFSNNLIFLRIFQINNYEFWSYFSEHFKQFCKSRFEESIEEIIMAEKFFEKIKPSLIIHMYEIASQEKILIYFARKYGIKSIVLQHGTPHIYFPNFSSLNRFHGTLPIYPEKKIFLWGNMMGKYALENGVNNKNIILSGSPRHDPYFLMKDKKFSNDEIILIVLAQIDKKNSGSQLTEIYLNYEKILKIICNKLKPITNYKKIIKLHPGDMVWKTVIVEPIIKSIDPSIKIISDGNLPELILSSLVVISVGLTTVLMEANIFEKPTLTFLFDPQELSSGLCSGNTKFFQISESKHFENELNDIINDHDKIKNFIDKGNKFLIQYMVNPGTSSKFISEKIDEFISK